MEMLQQSISTFMPMMMQSMMTDGAHVLLYPRGRRADAGHDVLHDDELYAPDDDGHDGVVWH